MNLNTSKEETLKIRMDSTTSQLLEQARHYVDLDKSKFIRQCIHEKAEAIIAEHETTRFSSGDWQLFFEMLDNPHEPTARMKKAALTYQKIIKTE